MKTNRGLGPIAIVLILAVLLGGGYLFAQKVGHFADNTPNDIIQPQIQNNVNIGDWKTYRNEKYGFEFQYPSDWGKCSPDTEENHEKSAAQLFCIEQSIPNNSLNQSKVVRLLIDPEKVSAFHTYTTLAHYLKTGHETAQKAGLYSVFKEGTTDSVSFIQSGAGDVGTWGHFYVFLKSHLLVVGYNNAADIVEQILFTFRLTRAKGNLYGDWYDY